MARLLVQRTRSSLQHVTDIRTPSALDRRSLSAASRRQKLAFRGSPPTNINLPVGCGAPYGLKGLLLRYADLGIPTVIHLLIVLVEAVPHHGT